MSQPNLSKILKQADKYYNQFFITRKKKVLSQKEMLDDRVDEVDRLISLLSQDKEAMKRRAGWWLFFQHGEKCPVDNKELLGADLFLECYGQCDPTCSPQEKQQAEVLKNQVTQNADPVNFTVKGPVPFQCPNRHHLQYDGKQVTTRSADLVDKFIDYCVDVLGKAPAAWQE